MMVNKQNQKWKLIQIFHKINKCVKDMFSLNINSKLTNIKSIIFNNVARGDEFSVIISTHAMCFFMEFE